MRSTLAGRETHFMEMRAMTREGGAETQKIQDGIMRHEKRWRSVFRTGSGDKDKADETTRIEC